MALCNVAGIFDTVEEYWDESLLAKAFTSVEGTTRESVQQFEADFASYLGGDCTALFVSSGREAMRLALSLLEPRSDAMVMVPNFTCPVVGDAVAQAGFQVCLFDFAPAARWPHWDVLESALRAGRIVAIIVPHLFGLPCDIRPLLNMAHHYGVFVIEDCAHCLGGQIHDRMVGTLGDFSIFSFNYDKPISLGGGGMLVCNSIPLVNEGLWRDLSARVRADIVTPDTEYETLHEFKSWLCARRTNITKASQYSSRPWRNLARFVLSIPGIRYLRKLMVRHNQSNAVSSWFKNVGPLRAALGTLLLGTYPAVLEKRNDNYASFAQLIDSYNLRGLLGCCSKDIVPAWLKAKLIIRNLSQSDVDALGRYMCSLGFRVGRFNWPNTLCQRLDPNSYIVATSNYKESLRFASLSLDFPIHQNMGEEDIARMVEILIKWLR